MIEIISGFECVRIIGKEKGLKENIDVLRTTQHYARFREDLELAKKIGFKTLRVGVPWHLIEEKKGFYNWTWMDEYMFVVRELQIEPILDPLHHVSIPSWLEGGFLSPEFYQRYCLFFMNVVNRYPLVKKYTIVNEPLVTTYFATHEGIWYPFQTGEENFQKGLDIIYRVIYDMSIFLKGEDKEHWYIDPSEYHYGTCDSSKEFAEMKNNSFRFKLLDRLLLQEEPAFISVLGLDYYAHCEFEWCSAGRQITRNPIGFAEIAKEYYQRYKLPIALTETNIRESDRKETTTDRQTWFKYMYKQCLKLEREEIPIKAFCWYPFLDSTDWCTLVTECNKFEDRQGIIHLDRQENEFSKTIEQLIAGQITIDKVKEYEYPNPLKEQLQGFSGT